MQPFLAVFLLAAPLRVEVRATLLVQDPPRSELVLLLLLPGLVVVPRLVHPSRHQVLDHGRRDRVLDPGLITDPFSASIWIHT